MMKEEAEKHYIVATIKPWNIEQFNKTISKYPGKWHLVTDPKKLTPALIQKIKPRYIFFPHWSWIVQSGILEAVECVCFHETDVPYGRGGSPIQNLIVRGHKNTKITALRMEAGLDTGPVYMKKAVSLAGSGQEIFLRIAPIVARMIREIARKEINPKPQKGKPTLFKRRSPDESNVGLVAKEPLRKVYDVIRMLDAQSYPHAFLEVGDLRMGFSDAVLNKQGLHATVRISKKHDRSKK